MATETPRASNTPIGPARRWLVLATVGLAQFMVMLDATVVNVALPTLRTDLGATTSQLQWIVDAYVLVFGSLLLLGGRAADLFGRRRVFAVGLAVFVAASIWCGLADSATFLIAARATQGLGASMLSPAALSIIVSTFTDPGERRTAMTVWAALAAIGGTLGVVAGGALITWASWPWAFWINLPIGILTAVLTAWYVPALRVVSDRRPRLDLFGGLLATTGLGSVIFGLISASDHGWTSHETIAPLVAGLFLLGVFGLQQRQRTDPLLPLRLLRQGLLLLSAVGLLLISGLMMSTFFMLSLYQQQVLGYTALQAGMGIAALGLATLAVFPAVPRLMTRLGPPRLYLAGGLLVLVGVVLLAWLPTETSTFASGLLPGLILLGCGIPCCFATLNAMGVSAVQPAESGAASGILTTFNQTGAALGMSTIVTFATTSASGRLNDGQSPVRALVGGFQTGYLALAAVAVVMVIVAVALLGGLWRR